MNTMDIFDDADSDKGRLHEDMSEIESSLSEFGPEKIKTIVVALKKSAFYLSYTKTSGVKVERGSAAYNASLVVLYASNGGEVVIDTRAVKLIRKGSSNTLVMETDLVQYQFHR